MMRTVFRSTLVLSFTVALLTCSDGFAQNSKYSRDNFAVRSAFLEVVAPARQSTALVFSKGKQVAVGAVVDKQGHVLTKASELREDLECIFLGGERLKAEIIGIAEEDDLAMLKVTGGKSEFKAIAWAEDIPPVGSFLATVGVEERPLAVGVMSVPTRAPRTQFRWNRGFLGVTVSGGADNAATIARVSPGSPAGKANLRVNDVVTNVNGKDVTNADQMIGMLRNREVGEIVELRVKRKDKELTFKIELGWFGGMNQEQNSLGGPLSGRRYGFRSVFQHDTYLRPEHCGGPLLNTDGKAVGVNIARVGRVSSQAIPVKVVRQVLPDLLSGKLAPKGDERNTSLKKPATQPTEKKAQPDKKAEPKQAEKKKPDGKNKKPAKKPAKKAEPKKQKPKAGNKK